MTTTPMSKIDADDGRCSEPYMIEVSLKNELIVCKNNIS